MNARDDGGPAFPTTAEQSPGGVFADHGMTLRDYFAAKALTGCLPMVDVFGRELERQGKGDTDIRTFIAAMAYGYADAMLKERQR